MEKIILIFSISAAGYITSELIISIWLDWFKKMPIKPFSCGYCLSFWIGLNVFILKDASINSFGLACICAVLNALLYKQLNK
jgi:hypothetical protein